MELPIQQRQVKVGIALFVIGIIFFLHIPVATAQVEFERIKDSDPYLFSPEVLLNRDCEEFGERYARVCRRMKIAKYLLLRKQAEEKEKYARMEKLLERAQTLTRYLKPFRDRYERKVRTQKAHENITRIPAARRQKALNEYRGIMRKGERYCRYERVSRERARCFARYRKRAQEHVTGELKESIFEVR